MSKLGRDLKDVIIIDNSPSAYIFQPENAIPISSWYSNSKDRELYRLVPLLVKLSKLDDVRVKSINPHSRSGSPPGSPKTPNKHMKLVETPGRLRVSKSKRLLIKTNEEIKLNFETTDRTSTHREQHRASAKRSHLNQLFKPGMTTTGWTKELTIDKRSPLTSRKKMLTKNIDFWRDNNFMNTFKTPKHSLKNQGK